MRPKALTGFFKCGSTWIFSLTRKNSDGTPIDLTGQTARAIFRSDSVDGTAILTLTELNGLSIDTPVNGIISIGLNPLQTALFPVGIRVYFDIELTTTATGEVWQSPTYYIISEQEVTKDD